MSPASCVLKSAMSSLEGNKPLLPAELTDEIISCIHESPSPWKDLSACSLACKTWLPASRSHLFHSIRIKLHKATRWNEFLKSSHLTTYLRHVEIMEQPEVASEMTYLDRKTLTDALYAILPQLAQLLTVTSLTIDVISWVAWEDFQLDYLCSAFRNITDLELCNAKFRDAQQLMHVLCHFAFLKRVSLVRIKAKPLDSDEYSGQLASSLHTLKITFRKAIFGGEANWLCKYYDLAAVRHLELRNVLPSELAPAGALMQHLGDHLFFLVLSFDWSVATSAISTYFQPQYNTNLRQVHLIVHVFNTGEDDPHDPTRWDWLCSLLSSISSPLRSLIIEIQGSGAALQDLNWSLLAQALDGPQFSVLQRLQFASMNTDYLRGLVQVHLPRWYTRGITEVVYIDMA
ncbi:hypothetical protein C8J57DRAFT_1277475 [Mycena rebaudengoi]|nr:hypothetical protein C8J57DRAFT_1277475 [Mycena rebaudengoi]